MGLRLASVREQEIERRLAGSTSRQSPWSTVAFSSPASSSAASAARSVVELDGDERDLRVERGEDPRRPDAAAGADLGDARAAALAREHLEQAAGLGAAGPRESGTLGEGERSLDERRKHVPTLTRWPTSFRCPRTGIPTASARSGASTTPSASRTPSAGASSTAIATAADDRFRIALVVVDVQNTFCTPGFELFVAGRSGTGALDDSRRLCEFVYRNLGALTQSVPTLDTHQALQIFHRTCSIDEAGTPSGAVHDGHRGGCRRGPLADQPGGRGGPRARPRLRGRAPALLHAHARGGRQVQPHRLAVPRDAGRDRLRAGARPSRRRCSSSRSRAGRRPTSSPRATTRSPSTTRCSARRSRSTSKASRSAGATSRSSSELLRVRRRR